MTRDSDQRWIPQPYIENIRGPPNISEFSTRALLCLSLSTRRQHLSVQSPYGCPIIRNLEYQLGTDCHRDPSLGDVPLGGTAVVIGGIDMNYLHARFPLRYPSVSQLLTLVRRRVDRSAPLSSHIRVSLSTVRDVF